MTWRRLPAWIGAISLLLGLGACVPQTPTKTPPTPPPERIRIPDLAPHASTQPATRPAPVPVLAVQVTRLDYPFAQDLQPALRLARRAPVSLDQLDLWRVNGIYVGVLEEKHRAAFMTALPRPQGGEARRILAPQGYNPLAFSPPLGPRTAQFVLTRSDGREHTVRFPGGLVRLLLQARQPVPGATLLTLTPQHHVERASIVPRLPQEKILDGTVLTDLTLQTVLRPDQILILALEKQPIPDLPEPEPPATQPAPATQPDDAGATDQPAQAIIAQEDNPALRQASPRVPIHLGSVLLGMRRGGRPMQSVVLIEARQIIPGRE